jgi:dipeptidyl aminopeptidase/acylaminoacyl peptidase
VLHGGSADNFIRRFSGSRYAFPVQVLASQGYAVFRPNPHGSGNYGQKFSDAILKDWGGIDLEDILSGTQFLIDQKIADPKRIAVGGWSYGGYLAALASSQSKFFKTCVVGAGITSLWSYIGQVDVDEFVETYMGAPEHNAKLYTERSPVSFVHRVKAPTLLIYGADDDRVPEEQGLEYFRGLKRNGVQTELWVIPQMGHRLSNPNHYRQVTDKIVGWLKQYL